MNWDRIEGQWKQRRGKAVHHWGKLMNDELAAIAGKHEQVVGMLQEKYGIAKEEVKRHVTVYKKIMEQLKKSNANLMKMKSETRSKKKKMKTTATKLSTTQRTTKRRSA
ncbi:MAG: CsbD family protein [Bacteroidota bacterium]|jgi:uncharacterized protein YjbJ (UPF0337 family)